MIQTTERARKVARFAALSLARLTAVTAFLAAWLCAAPAVAADNAEGAVDARPSILLGEEPDPETPRPLAFKPIEIRPLTAADLPPSNPLYGRVGGSSPHRMSVAFSRDWQAGRDEYRAIIERESRMFGLPPALLDAVMAVESGYNPAVIGFDGEIGLMQLMPATARMLGFAGSASELATPDINIHYGAKYLAGAWRLAGEDLCTATMKYRAGHGESRFSFRSVDYCVRVRGHLAARGVAVSGAVPQPSFGGGSAVTAPATATASRPRGRGRMLLGGGSVNLAALNLRLRELSEKIAVRR